MHPGNLSQIDLPDMWLLVQIWYIIINVTHIIVVLIIYINTNDVSINYLKLEKATNKHPKRIFLIFRF